MQKRVLAINDISCMGKCSLTVALPIISAVGHECVILPTALLSTHTAQKFGKFVSFDMAEEMNKIADHWSDMNIGFDAIYTGYITSPEQAQTVYDIVCRFKRENTLVVVDPVLGDNGRLYRGFSEKNIDSLLRLCSVADIITPNLTEGALLTGIESDGTHITAENAEKMLDALGEICKNRVILTGAETESGVISTVARDCVTGETVFFNKPKITGAVHGSGDIFASALTALCLSKDSFFEAVQGAVNFVYRAVSDFGADNESRWYGVNFEKHLCEIKNM